MSVDSHNLTRELSSEEDGRVATPVQVDHDHVDEIFDVLLDASPVPNVPASNGDAASGLDTRDRDRARVVLCRLLLGPTAVPCYCDEWDADEYLTECVFRCEGPLLYAYRKGCQCYEASALQFTVICNHPVNRAFRGLLSLMEWNAHLRNVFCGCCRYRTDRYVLAALPARYPIFLVYYPYFLRCLCRYLSVAEIDDCTNAMMIHLGSQLSARITIHYKLLFGMSIRPGLTPCAVAANESFFVLELQKLWLSVNYINAVTTDFFENVFAAFHRDKSQAMLVLRVPSRTEPTLSRFSMSRFKSQVLYFRLPVRYVRNRHDVPRNSFQVKRLSIVFRDSDAIWRNLFVLYYAYCYDGNECAGSGLGSGDGDNACRSATSPPAAAPTCDTRGRSQRGRESSPSRSAGPCVRRSGDGPSSLPSDTCAPPPSAATTASSPALGAKIPRALRSAIDGSATSVKKYVRIVSRLTFANYRERLARRAAAAGSDADLGDSFDFSCRRVRSRDGFGSDAEGDRVPSPRCDRRLVIGGREFSEMTSVGLDRMTVNAFNTNRVINLKAALAKCKSARLSRHPKNMTHSFVMYKHTFKEPACTISTFVSNDVACTNSLNVNIRGSYLEFIYALGVYRLYVDIKNFFLPATVCNSNSSLDVHGLEDQSVVRSERHKVYWTTNFPCMISTTDRINVGWFKAATAIIPKVSGRSLETIMLKELSHICRMKDVSIDYGIHRIFTELETRNSYQVPFLGKQFILFLRASLLRIHGHEHKTKIDNILFRVIKDGLFDYHKDMVAHTKIKHTCALIGTRLANNIPKVLVRNKKIKLDYLGRNANVLTLCRYLDLSRIAPSRVSVLLDVLTCLAEASDTPRIKAEILRVCGRLRGETTTAAAVASTGRTPTRSRETPPSQDGLVARRRGIPATASVETDGVVRLDDGDDGHRGSDVRRGDLARRSAPAAR